MKTENKVLKRISRIAGIKSEQLIPISFFGAILLGALLLMLPFSTAKGESTSFVTALFTSTTSICVTGLVVVDTFSHWSLFGKIIILILIQLGGFGIIAVSSFIMLLFKKNISYKNRALIHDTYNMDTFKGVVRFLVKVFKGTFIVEMLGAFLYMPAFIPKFGLVKGIWVSVFNSISAFCNAGIDILGPDSLISFAEKPYVLFVTMFLIVMGGMGYVVWFDILTETRKGIKKKFKPITIFKHYSEHTRLVIHLTLALILGGAVITFISEYNNPDTIGNMSLVNKIINSLFQSVTYRTAGFASVPQECLRDGSCLLGLLLMFIGGSPVGTAGGVKTVTLFIVVINAVSYIRSRRETTIKGKRVTGEMIQKASAIVFVSFTVTFIMMLLLMLIDNIGLMDASFEVVSATATVGLSRALTSSLSTAGRIIIIISMYLGRIGPISMALFFANKPSGENLVNYADGRFYVG